MVPLLSASADVVAPDLRGFGSSDKHPEPPERAYTAHAQARSVLGLMDELQLGAAVLAGYDVGSRVAQTLARAVPERVRALVLSPPLPGIGDRVLSADAQREFWYQTFHQSELVEQLIDGKRQAVRAYLRHFWSHWSGPRFEPGGPDLDRLADAYAQPGALTASIAWYRAGAGTVAASIAETSPVPADRVATPTTVLWPEHDPLFPAAWSDRLDRFFSDVVVRHLPKSGHFTPLEDPGAFAAAINERLAA